MRTSRLREALIISLLACQSFGQILTRDSLALVDFHDKTFGNDWLNNFGWLKEPASRWIGVGLDPGGQVISLRLPGNGLKGYVPSSIKDLPSLHVLDLSNNQLESIPDAFKDFHISVVDVSHNKLSALPDFSTITRTFQLFVNNNKLDFEDLEPNAGLNGLVYYRQDSIGVSIIKVVDTGDSHSFSIITLGEFNYYQWYRNGVKLEDKTSPQLTFDSISFNDLGHYYCEVSNDLLPNLILTSKQNHLVAITKLNIIIHNVNSVPIPAKIYFYENHNGKLKLSNELSAVNGIINDLPFNMGEYVMKIKPENSEYPPVYFESGSHHWQDVLPVRIDGNQSELDMQVQKVDRISGSSSISGNLIGKELERDQVDIYLYEVTGGQKILRDFTFPDASLNFEFSSLPASSYKIEIDIPGVSFVNDKDNVIIVEDNANFNFTLSIEEGNDILLKDQSVARNWNEALLDAIRNDFARPTIHARNLFHISAAMYDAWAAFDSVALPYLLGNYVHGFSCGFEDVQPSNDVKADREKAISYAAFRLLNHRFQYSPAATESLAMFERLMMEMGYNPSYTSDDYSSGDAAALGNYIAQCYLDYGLQDGSNEANQYVNTAYSPVNTPLIPLLPGNPDLDNPNRWQPLTLEVFIDQAGNQIPRNTPEFLSAEWGIVSPFSLTEDNINIYERDGFEYWVYHDPGKPPYLDLSGNGDLEDEYKWGFSLVSIWSAHLDPDDGVMIDISPASIGNNPDLPTSFEEYDRFYKLFEGGDQSMGYTVNIKTGQPYSPQIVPMGDYTRVLAEFWADGPDSETPPGHWFTILNYVNDHPLFEKKYKGAGPVLDNLEWDVKTYFTLSGAMHDAAVCAWGIKGWYDYIRPISAIRSMADRGQSSDSNLPGFDPDGITLVPGYIEIVQNGDPLSGSENENVDKIKLYAWRGHDYIENPVNFKAGVGWILAENWWPYQRPSFVTPPFAGYISGHSTFSRAAAELLALLTGDEYFPGGLGEFVAQKDKFLVFEDGPSVDVILQWATYRDASDQTSLSRIWGGIHPPADDIPGRIIGEKIGIDAFNFAENYFLGTPTTNSPIVVGENPVEVYPNPINNEMLNTFSKKFLSED